MISLYRASYIFLFLSPVLAIAGTNPVVGDLYRNRYPLTTATEKFIDNTGVGFEALYGTRNFRSVLNGVYYRGGANNSYLKPVSRSNMNPLPDVGLNDLCQEGFTDAVYLYATNFASAPHSVNCTTFQGTPNTLTYYQLSPLDPNGFSSIQMANLQQLLTLIYNHVKNPDLGAIYAHCWNGWHSSGFVAATALRQFCGFTGDEAVNYWNLNTDGNNVGKSYDSIRANIRAFVPFSNMSITDEEKAALCPDPNTLHF